jgi:hypothetical protein
MTIRQTVLAYCLPVCILFTGMGAEAQDNTCASWPRVLPPEGLEIPLERQVEWEKRIRLLDSQLNKADRPANWSDVAVLVKACKLAIQFREFYQEKDFAKCDRLLSLAEERINGSRLSVAGRRIGTASGFDRSRQDRRRQQASVVCVVAWTR